MSDDYKRCLLKQLEEWVDGNPLHTNNLPDGYVLPKNMDYECCPDFSCCKPEQAWSKDQKLRFVKAYREDDQPLIMQMLTMSLDALITGVEIDTGTKMHQIVEKYQSYEH